MDDRRERLSKDLAGMRWALLVWLVVMTAVCLGVTLMVVWG